MNTTTSPAHEAYGGGEGTPPGPGELTADERATLATGNAPVVYVRHLFALYDAALTQSEYRRIACERLESERDAARARAEAAERVSKAAEGHLEQHRKEDPHDVSRLQHEIWQLSSECKALSCAKVLAESRLTAATDLLERCKLELPASSWTTSLLGDVTAFLSTAPAQAAEPAAERVCQNCHLAAQYAVDDGKCPEHAPAAEPAPDTAADRAIADCRAAIDSLAHPDTIALRECRAELERTRVEFADYEKETTLTLESTRADLATAKKALECFQEAARSSNLWWQKQCDERGEQLGTARARIAELKAENTQLQTFREALKPLDYRALQTRIDQAAAELRGANGSSDHDAAAIIRALAILRGGRT